MPTKQQYLALHENGLVSRESLLQAFEIEDAPAIAPVTVDYLVNYPIQQVEDIVQEDHRHPMEEVVLEMILGTVNRLA